MKFVIIFSCVIAASCAAKLTHIDYEWDAWKAKHMKLYYDGKEEAIRRNIWEKNLAFVDRHNKEESQGKHTFRVEMNKFADLDNLEFAKYFLGYKQSQSSSNFQGCLTNSSFHILDNNYGTLPTEVDWRTKGIVTEVKNQGQCGSCWAFSTTGSLEGQHAIKTGQLVSLSEQNLMDCSKSFGDNSCNGGLMDYAFQYIIENGGIDTEKSYPYRAADQPTCYYNAANSGATMTSCVDVMPRQDESALMKAVGHVGPVSVAIDASHSSFQLYSSGVYNEYSCSQTALDHGVLAVGYGTDNGDDYWIVKNSWGAEWGLRGYIKMSRNRDNQCGIATQASYPIV